MLDHVGVQVADLDASASFYDTLLAPLGGARLMDYSPEALGYGVGQMPTFWLSRLAEGQPHDTREIHVAFIAPDRAAVVAFRDAAEGLGVEILHEPRVFPEYHANYFGAFVRDLDGNNVEAVCHLPE